MRNAVKFGWQRKSAKDVKDHFLNVSIYIALVPPWRHSNKEKNQEDLKKRIIRALEIANQNNLLTIAFPPLGNGIFGFSTDLCGTIMLKTMRYFINKNFNSSLRITCVVVNNIRKVKTFTRIIMANNLWDYICRKIYNFLKFCFAEHLISEKIWLSKQ